MEKPYDRQYLEALAHKYRQGTITPEEQVYFDKWYSHHPDAELDLSESPVSPEVIRRQMLYQIENHIRTTKPGGRIRYWKYVAATAATVICALTVYLFLAPEKNKEKIVAASQIKPGSNGAILTLAGGKKILLEQASQGIIQSEGNTTLEKANDSLLVYTTGQNSTTEITYNTLETPSGRQYAVVLPDGSKVWLNAASTLKYPTAFNGKERTVTLTGEAYFEIAKDKAHPFVVSSAGQEVRVLGTHFNINSYADEGKTVTTLAEGSVQVRAGSRNKLLSPGRQAVLLSNGDLSSQRANLETALAWKNNKMTFEDAGIAEIMRQVSRWYDLDIKYEGKIPDDTFNGTINRQSNLATVLKMFELTAIRFRVEQTGSRKTLIIKI